MTATNNEVEIKGTVIDKSEIVEVLVDNYPVNIKDNQFAINLFIADENSIVKIEATDKLGNSSSLMLLCNSKWDSNKILQLAKLEINFIYQR